MADIKRMASIGYILRRNVVNGENVENVAIEINPCIAQRNNCIHRLREEVALEVIESLKNRHVISNIVFTEDGESDTQSYVLEI